MGDGRDTCFKSSDAEQGPDAVAVECSEAHMHDEAWANDSRERVMHTIYAGIWSNVLVKCPHSGALNEPGTGQEQHLWTIGRGEW